MENNVSRVSLCSSCKMPQDRKGQRYCRLCHNSYSRKNGLKYKNFNLIQKGKGISRSIANVYQKRGKLIKKPCQNCNDLIDVEKHHEDYNNPLIVEWLCRPCHRAKHEEMKKMFNIYIGGDSRFEKAYEVCESSLRATHDGGLNIHKLDLTELRQHGLYSRPTSIKDGLLHDDISAAPMSTEFAISRFLVPHLSGFAGWSLFCDSDFLFRSDVEKLFQQADKKYAVMCVHHKYAPPEGIKMDGQAQMNYARKNWSSLMLFNNEHPMNKFLSVENVNKFTGRDLHRFCWLLDSQIGELDESWNWLEGHSSTEISPDAVHFTRGTPDLAGYENVPYADNWRAYADR